ncbi:imm68 putative immunity domain-containing protein [Prevotella sp. HUN102]|uniref:imm68 putative immunity domain-containing protein n=1 Tax=Prevotella sp. HUN102 TaxID=1392486 RepID=UPI00048A8699|nr:imm68 putative immunity domain-containing protein [Prevotella sp. HUN102]
MELYIKKWWGNYVGGCDDTFLLLDYFGSQKQDNLELSKILSDIHLNTLLKENSVNEGDAYFTINESYEPHFDMATDVIIDLSAILLESIKNGKVNMKELDPNSEYSNFFSISTSKDDAMLLLNGLNNFINTPQEYELADFMDESELEELVSDCKEISGILTDCISQM